MRGGSSPPTGTIIIKALSLIGWGFFLPFFDGFLFIIVVQEQSFCMIQANSKVMK